MVVLPQKTAKMAGRNDGGVENTLVARLRTLVFAGIGLLQDVYILWRRSSKNAKRHSEDPE